MLKKLKNGVTASGLVYKMHLIKMKKEENVSQKAHMHEHVESGLRRTEQVSPKVGGLL